MKPKILYLLCEWPWPNDSGARVHDKIILRCLADNWETHVACWDFRPVPKFFKNIKSLFVLSFHHLSTKEKWFAASLALIFGYPIPNKQFMTQKALFELFNVINDVKPDIIILSGVEICVLLPWLKKNCSSKLILDIHDVQTQRTKSILDSIPKNKIIKKMKHKALLKSYESIERKFFPCSDAIWVLKEEDKDILDSYKESYNINIVPNVIDSEAIVKQRHEINKDEEGQISAVYVGNYSGQPNEACAMNLIKIFEEQNIVKTKIKLYLVGVNPTDAMKRKTSNHDNIIVTGEVDALSEYLRPFDTIFVAPLISGGGIKRKIIEAMMYGCAVLTTSVGAEGLEIENGISAIIAEPHEFPGKLLELITDHKRRIEIASAGRRHIERRFGYERLLEAVRQSFVELNISIF